jgi:hypothetical protein
MQEHLCLISGLRNLLEQNVQAYTFRDINSLYKN